MSYIQYKKRLVYLFAVIGSLAVHSIGDSARADVVTGGALVIDFDGDAFANGGNELALQSVGISLTPGQAFMEFGLHGNGVLPGRPASPATATDFSDLRDGWVRPSTEGLGYTFNAGAGSPLEFDPSSIASVGAQGAATFAGGDAFWYANDAVIATGSVWLQFGNYALHYDETRSEGENSGWLLTNTVLQTLPLFDIRNLSIDSVAAGIDTAGSLSLSGDLYVSDEFSAAWYLQPELNVGTFSFAGVTAIPEPSSFACLAIGALGLSLVRRKRSTIERNRDAGEENAS
ncbi:PEP-CTERM sorting domain-containing protein [Rhodopirellula sp. MGV]|uniref:PEP-CTERM sorting domain-containing protein n=1 Tax=Rhodopirellula sp. MGV TaxID=2023130 RepID=UPI00130405F4|nr:PEP-CTERM sorting domain-containing protein [Rhodopirellula sp. MGV]